MNLSAQPPRLASVFTTGFRFLLGLIPFMAIASPSLTSVVGWPIRSRPYLAVLGSSPLRIEEALPPADLSVRPPAGAPPQPAPTAIRSPVAMPPAGETSPPAEVSASTETPAPMTSSPTGSTAAPAPEAKPAKPAKSILPDDTRPKVRAEDFLPFFQPPGSSQNPNDVTVAPTPPAPGTQMPSSATYRQQ